MGRIKLDIHVEHLGQGKYPTLEPPKVSWKVSEALPLSFVAWAESSVHFSDVQ